ncbi:MAG: hypothetical protein IJ485_00095, partial [Lachnospiraceae bacterium]|nr:hypothetical protein [Lachnospiraceae bacterium]
MDSKLRTITVVTALMLMLTIFLVVILMNTDSTRNAQEVQSIQQTVVVEEVSKEQDLSAFMWDETFFDDKPKENIAKELDEQQIEEISMYITSVEKDIRIQVLDGMGKLLRNQELYVELDSGEEYKDL